MSNINSAVVIARLLGCEGFTDHLANQIERYWRRSSGLTDRQERQIVKLDMAIAEIANKLDVKERLALGRFIGLHKKMSFDTGLRIGMTAFVQQAAGDHHEQEAPNGTATPQTRKSKTQLRKERRQKSLAAQTERAQNSSQALVGEATPEGKPE